MRNCGMYDISNNANLKLLENNINANIVVMADCLTIGTLHVDQGEANGLYANYGRYVVH